MRNSRRSNPDGLSTKGALGRAMRYLSHYRRQAALPYLFLVIATLAMLAVPRLVSNIIDAITQGVVATNTLNALAKIPAAAMSMALPKILDYLKLPAGTEPGAAHRLPDRTENQRTHRSDYGRHRHRDLRRAARAFRFLAVVLGGAQLAGGGF